MIFKAKDKEFVAYHDGYQFWRSMSLPESEKARLHYVSCPILHRVGGPALTYPNGYKGSSKKRPCDYLA